ncbi:hypothetical protein N7G274_005287 [Stereocaulon virgatum]|uniref:F-box domain-containing protein n=1 Tax=Stereocaulon virgatum TaxID=373712 RepID=A0ABR4A9C3_9LECA
MDGDEESMPDAIRDRKDTADCSLGDWKSLHDECRKLFRVERFEDAIKCFTLILKTCPDAPLMVRDHRAATYIKVGDLTAALRDGRKMIQEAEQDCMGYLRTGRILKLMGQQNQAMKIYKLGIDKIPWTVPDRKLLRIQHARLVYKKRNDPLRALPLELIEMTLKYLDFTEVVQLRQVSKSWQQFIDTFPNLWSHLDFSNARRPMALSTVRKYVDRSKGKVTRVSLGRFVLREQKVPHYIASHCQELQELRVPEGYVPQSVFNAAPYASKLKTLIVTSQSRIASWRVMQVLSLCPNLETAKFSTVTPSGWRFNEHINSPLLNLRSLTMKSSLRNPRRSHPQDQTIIPLNEFICRMPNLRELSLSQWAMEKVDPFPVQYFSTSQTLETLIMRGCHVYAPPGPFLPSSLRYLDMERCTSENASPMEWNAPPTELVWLSIAGMVVIPLDTFIKWLEPNKGKLRYIDASGIPDNRHYWKALGEMGFLAGVEELKFNSSELSDKTIVALSTKLPVLKKLHLKHTMITGVGLKAVVTKLQGTLEFLDLDGCNRMGFDAVEWARNKGIKVSFTFADVKKRRRRTLEDY